MNEIKEQFNYKFQDFALKIKKESIVKSIMTNNVYFYEDKKFEDDKIRIDFCIERDIDSLPSKDSKFVYRLKENKFEKKIISDEDKINSDEYIFKEEILDSFQEKRSLRWVFFNGKIVGVIHFCDYNRKSVYVLLYSLVTELEESIRILFERNNIKEEELIDYLKRNQKIKEICEEVEKIYKKYLDKTCPFQSFNLSHIICFYNSLIKKNKIKNYSSIKETGKLNELRNAVMHSRNHILVKNYGNASEKYDFNSFKDFKERVLLLLETIKKINNENEKQNN